jgi:uncharacterized SAM-binding protein YcdF (DUF218 family)
MRFRPALHRHRLLLIVAVVVLAVGGWMFTQAGAILVREDPLARADAIFVFAGTYVERPLEAADLYLAGYAPRVVISRASLEPDAANAARARGVTLADDADLRRRLLVDVGVPEAAIITSERLHDNTAEEVQTLRELATTHGWRRVIVVSSKYHMRRVSLASRRALRGTQVTLICRASRYDPATPDRWWRRRADVRMVVTELPKLAAYAAGFGG